MSMWNAAENILPNATMDYIYLLRGSYTIWSIASYIMLSSFRGSQYVDSP
jgi:hypothetical protein